MQQNTQQKNSSTPPACHVPFVDHCAPVKQAQTVLRPPCCPPDNRTCPRTDVGSEKCSLRPVLDGSGARPNCFTDDDVSPASPSSKLRNTLEFCQASHSHAAANTGFEVWGWGLGLGEEGGGRGSWPLPSGLVGGPVSGGLADGWSNGGVVQQRGE